MKRHDIIATHDLASTQALWQFNPEVAIKVAEAFCLVEPDDFDGEVGIADLTTALKTWKGLNKETTGSDANVCVVNRSMRLNGSVKIPSWRRANGVRCGDRQRVSDGLQTRHW